MANADSTPEAKAKSAEYMREYGRKRGAIAVKDVQIKCACCGNETEKQHRSHNWCADCLKPSQLARRRERNAANGTTSVGSLLVCKECATEFIKEHKRQFYCPPCSALSDKSRLPANKIVLNEFAKKYNKIRRREDPAYAIAGRISAQIGQAIREKKAGKSWELIVGYGISDLMNHLERQFLKGMSWENRSSWHIDHIMPVSSFTFSNNDDPELRRCWALSNLRPLWAVDNVKKADRRTHLL